MAQLDPFAPFLESAVREAAGRNVGPALSPQGHPHIREPGPRRPLGRRYRLRLPGPADTRRPGRCAIGTAGGADGRPAAGHASGRTGHGPLPVRRRPGRLRGRGPGLPRLATAMACGLSGLPSPRDHDAARGVSTREQGRGPRSGHPRVFVCCGTARHAVTWGERSCPPCSRAPRTTASRSSSSPFPSAPRHFCSFPAAKPTVRMRGSTAHGKRPRAAVPRCLHPARWDLGQWKPSMPGVSMPMARMPGG